MPLSRSGDIPQTGVPPLAYFTGNITSNTTTLTSGSFRSSDGGLLTAFIISSASFVVLLLLFVALRRRYSAIYSPRCTVSKRNSLTEGADLSDLLASGASDSDGPGLLESPPGAFGWVGSTLRFSDDDLLKRCGLDAAIYLRYQQHMLQYLLPITFLSLVVILPMNATSHYNFQNALDLGGDVLEAYTRGFAETTINNIEPRSSKLWGHLIILYIVTGICYKLIASMVRSFVYLRGRQKEVDEGRTSIQNHSIILYDIPRAVRNDEMLAQYVDQIYQNSRLSSHLVRNCARLDSLYDKRSEAMKHKVLAESVLLHRQHKAEAKGGMKGQLQAVKRPTIQTGALALTGCGDKTDSIAFYTDQIDRLEVEISDEILTKRDMTGVGFVTFKDVSTATQVIQTWNMKRAAIGKFHLRLRRRAAGIGNDGDSFQPFRESLNPDTDPDAFPPVDWLLAPAPAPQDIIWGNLGLSWSQRRMRHFLVIIIMAYLILFWSVPVTFLGSLNKLAGAPIIGGAFKPLLNLPPAFLDFVASSLPTLVLAIFNLVLPSLMRSLSIREGTQTKSESQSRTMRKMFSFLLCSVVILPTVVIGAFGGLDRLGEEFEANPVSETLVFLSQLASPMTGFWIVYVLYQTAFNAPLIGLRLGPFFSRRYALARAVTPAQKALASKEEQFEYEAELPYTLLVVVISIFFSLSVPLTPVAGCIYLVAKFLFDKYTIVYIHPKPSVPSDGTMMASAIRMAYMAPLLLQLGMMAIFGGKQAWVEMGFAVVLPVVTSFMFIRSHRLLNAVFNQESWAGPELSIQSETPTTATHLDVQVVKTAYLHPAIREQMGMENHELLPHNENNII